MKNTYRFSQDFKLDTMDIVVAVLLGVIQAVIEIFTLLGFLERTVWATGPVGFAIYAFYNGTTWILFYAGVYLRKRAMIVILAVAVTALVRWFAGDPDGPVLMFYGPDFSRIHTSSDTLEFVKPSLLGDAAQMALAILRSPDFLAVGE